MDQVTKTLVRTGLPRDRDVEGRAVLVSFLDTGNVLVFCDDGDHRILSQVGMIDVWEELWRMTAHGIVEGGWERA